ncbi:HpcH/HpaI aldolase/citrate lyase family protein [Streptomyces chartreusis]|uniref:HpcH/HpaI aldolase/citrate lyase family protein n=1 Tax=Streptomyces chartreusis TaxID=1969 RepID=UPI0034476E72
MSQIFEGAALLFCPADRPDRFSKAAAAADMVILDLEDAVPAERKVQARANLTAHPLDPATVIVRINAARSADYAEDIAALRRTDYRWVMLPKAEDPREIDALAGCQVIALCETARGVVNAGQLAHAPGTRALMWGAEDLMASLGGGTSRLPDGTYRHISTHARATVLLHAAAAGIGAVDAVYLDTEDAEGLALEAEDAASSGFIAKACIHPRQANVVRQAFMPSYEDVQWARRVLSASRTEGAVFVLDGQMIDAPLLRQAEHLMRRSQADHPVR